MIAGPGGATESRTVILLLTAATLLCAPYTAAAQSLSQSAPTSIWARNPAQNVSPQIANPSLVGQESPQPAVRIFSQSRVAYDIPPDAHGFSATFLYDGSALLSTPNRATADNAIRLRVFADGRLLFDGIFTVLTPPRELSFDLGGARVLTFDATGHFGFDSVYLLQPAFVPQSASYASYSLPPATGYASFASSIDALFRGLTGPSVPLEVAYGGPASAAQLRLTLQPEQAQFPSYSLTTAIPLESAGSASQGKFDWQIPAAFGPAQLTTELLVEGKSVFRQSSRVAIVAPSAKLTASSPFALHTSTAGFSFAQDAAVPLWGAAWDRVYMAWNIIAPTPGVADYSRIDELVTALRRQNIRALGVLGENAPAWAGVPGPAYYAAWKKYVADTVRHFRGAIDHWEVFNEIDVKFYDSLRRADPNADIPLLRSAIDVIRTTCPECKIICCSTGTSTWLSYNRRILPALLDGIDFVSWHPYRYSAPEQKEGFYDYLGEIAVLDAITGSNSAAKPLWATEGNWIIGPYGAPNVRNPEMTEHTQTEYIVRTGLLSFSQGVPYFLHAPFYHSTHRQVQLDTLSAYAQMTALFADISEPRLWHEDRVYAVTAQRGDGTAVGAVWSAAAGAAIAISGLTRPRFADMYGNALQRDAMAINPGPAPLYFTAERGSVPAFELLSPTTPLVWTALPLWPEWQRNPASEYQSNNGELRVQQRSQYQYQLVSAPLAVIAGACYIVRFPLRVDAGAIGVFAIDAANGELASPAIYVSDDPDAPLRPAEFRILPGAHNSIQIVIANGNIVDILTDFTIAGVAELARCP